MITPTALQRYARRAALVRLKTSAALLALVPKASIDPAGTPTWPFILIEAPAMLPRRVACAHGADIAFDVHAFAGPKKSGSTVTQTGYDHASAIGAAIEAVLAPNHITLEDGSTCALSFSDARMLKDGDPDHWHWFAQLNCRVLKAVS